MVIGIDARLWNETGVGRYIRSIFRYLPQIDKTNEYVWFFSQKEYESVEMPSPKWRKVLADVHWHSVKEQILFPSIILKEKVDLMHFPYFAVPIFYPKKFIVTVHDLIIDHFKTGKDSTLPAWKYLIKKIGYKVVMMVALFRSKKVIAVSQTTKKEIIDHYGLSQNKIKVTYESGDLEVGNKIADIGISGKYVLYVGNAHPHKNLKNLIEAAKFFKGFKLVLVGDDNYFYPKLKEKKPDNVIFTGAIPNGQLSHYYKRSSGFVSASLMEGFGIPPLEAMSAGIPVFVSDIPIFHEICGDAAIYFNPNNPKEIAKVINNNFEKNNRMTELGYTRAKGFSWLKLAEETMKVYESCLGL